MFTDLRRFRSLSSLHNEQQAGHFVAFSEPQWLQVDYLSYSQAQPLVSPQASFPTLPTGTEVSDIAASISSTAVLAVNSSASGRVGALGDHDWYKVTLTVGHTYSFGLIGTGLSSLNNTYLSIRDSSGAIIVSDADSGPGLSSVIGMAGFGAGVFTASSTGTYFVDVGAQSDLSTGQYGVSVIESSSANGYKPSYDAYMGAGALHADASSGAPSDWNQVLGATRGQGVALTYSFRSSATYANSDSAAFSQCTTAEMDAVAKILTLFSDICNLTFTRVNPTGYSNSAQLVIANYTNVGSAAGAYAYYPASGERGGDLWLNTASVNPNSIIQGQYSWFAIAHEFGHALGLSHPGDYNAGAGSPTYSNSAQFIEDSEQYSIMSYWGGSNTGASPGYFATAFTPLLFDIYELQTLYGANLATRSGDTTYGFNNTAGTSYAFSSGSSPYYCIWDGGGTDMLDASGYSQSQTLSLVAGAFSSIGGGTSNISIALGAVVENAKTGSGNDTLTGNDAANVLDGGAGNDELRGGLADDILIGGAGVDYAAYSFARSYYSITYLGGTFTLRGAEGTDTITGVEYFRFTDQTIAASYFTSSNDTSAPIVSTFSPTDGATGVVASSNIVLTFSEDIQRGAGSIVIRSGSAAGVIVETFNATTSDRLTLSGSQLTIDPTNNLVDGTQYFVTFAAGSIMDLVGNSFAGTSTYDFTIKAPDFVAPTVAAFSPTDGATGVAPGSNIILTFSEDVQRGIGNIVIRSGSAKGTIIETFNAATSERLTLSGAQLTINPTSNLGDMTKYFVTFASGAIKDLAGNSFAGTTSYDFMTGITDTIAPTVTTFSPADGAANVATSSNIVLTFSEDVQRGVGNIVIHSGSSSGTAVETFDAAVSARLTLSGSQLTIDPTSNLADGTQYFVTFASGSIKDVSGNSFAGTTSYDFTTLIPDTTAPTVSTFSPTDGATNVTASSNIVLTFSEDVQRGVGNIVIRSGSSSGTAVETFDAATSARLTLSGSQLTIDPTSNLGDNTKYFVTFASGTIKDLAGNSFAGTTSYDFTTRIPDITAPIVSTFSPTDGATGVGIGSNIVLSFSEDVQRGVGNIVIRSGSASGTAFETFNAVTSARLTLSGSQLTIDPTNNLSNSTNYFVTFDSGSIKDLADNNFLGTNTYDFMTVAPDKVAPTVAAFSPTDGATGVATGSNIILAFSEDVQRGIGSIVIRSGSAKGTIIETFNAATSDRLTLSGAQLTIDPTSNLGNNTKYFVTFASGAIKDLAGNSFAGTTSYDFTTAASGAPAPLLAITSMDSIAVLDGNDAIAAAADVDAVLLAATNAGGNTLPATVNTLTGGAGADKFTLDTMACLGSNFIITDFEGGVDAILLKKTVFTSIEVKSGTLPETQFWSAAGATAAHDADDLIVYNTTTGSLYYDADGTGADAAIMVAILGVNAHPSLTCSDIQIIA